MTARAIFLSGGTRTSNDSPARHAYLIHSLSSSLNVMVMAGSDKTEQNRLPAAAAPLGLLYMAQHRLVQLHAWCLNMYCRQLSTLNRIHPSCVTHSVSRASHLD